MSSTVLVRTSSAPSFTFVSMVFLSARWRPDDSGRRVSASGWGSPSRSIRRSLSVTIRCGCCDSSDSSQLSASLRIPTRPPPWYQCGIASPWCRQSEFGMSYPSSWLGRMSLMLFGVCCVQAWPRSSSRSFLLSSSNRIPSTTTRTFSHTRLPWLPRPPRITS